MDSLRKLEQTTVVKKKKQQTEKDGVVEIDIEIKINIGTNCPHCFYSNRIGWQNRREQQSKRDLY